MSTFTDTLELEEVVLKELLVDQHKLILHNDDFNTFDFVIDTLVDVCGHSVVQAEQCAHIVHFNGKCDVKRGSKKQLEAPYKILQTKGLSVTIE